MITRFIRWTETYALATQAAIWATLLFLGILLVINFFVVLSWIIGIDAFIMLLFSMTVWILLFIMFWAFIV